MSRHPRKLGTTRQPVHGFRIPHEKIHDEHTQITRNAIKITHQRRDDGYQFGKLFK